MKLLNLLRTFFWVVLFLSIIGCSGKIGYHVGFVTHSVTGKIKKEAVVNDPSKSFVMVKEHIRTFMSDSEGDLHRIAAKIVKADEKGFYNVSYDSDVSQVDLYYFEEGYMMDSESFRKTLGVGRYEYNPFLKKDHNFKNSYYLAIKPILSELITEPRYKLPLSDQEFLKNWMDQMESKY